VQAIQVFAPEIQDYIADYPEAAELEVLLREPLPTDACSVLAGEAMQQHLAAVLADAQAERLQVDRLLATLKPNILGTYKAGSAEFQDRVLEALTEVLSESGAVDGQVWKLE